MIAHANLQELQKSSADSPPPATMAIITAYLHEMKQCSASPPAVSAHRVSLFACTSALQSEAA